VTWRPKPRPSKRRCGQDSWAKPAVVTAANAASTRALIDVLAAVDAQVIAMRMEAEAHFGQHPALRSSSANPVWGRSSRAGWSQSSMTTLTATPPPKPGKITLKPAIIRASGKKDVVTTRFVHNDRARAYYDSNARDANYNVALRQVAHRLVGILHG
jgi:hypothetical protein